MGKENINPFLIKESGATKLKDRAFIDLSFNGVAVSELGLTVTYDSNMLDIFGPQFENVTSSVSRRDGTLYWGTNITSATITKTLSTDSMTSSQYNQLKKLFVPGKVGKLILGLRPYCYMPVVIDSVPTTSLTPFDGITYVGSTSYNDTIYRGSIEVSFLCLLQHWLGWPNINFLDYKYDSENLPWLLLSGIVSDSGVTFLAGLKMLVDVDLISNTSDSDLIDTSGENNFSISQNLNTSVFTYSPQQNSTTVFSSDTIHISNDVFYSKSGTFSAGYNNINLKYIFLTGNTEGIDVYMPTGKYTVKCKIPNINGFDEIRCGIRIGLGTMANMTSYSSSLDGFTTIRNITLSSSNTISVWLYNPDGWDGVDLSDSKFMICTSDRTLDDYLLHIDYTVDNKIFEYTLLLSKTLYVWSYDTDTLTETQIDYYLLNSEIGLTAYNAGNAYASAKFSFYGNCKLSDTNLYVLTFISQSHMIRFYGDNQDLYLSIDPPRALQDVAYIINQAKNLTYTTGTSTDTVKQGFILLLKEDLDSNSQWKSKLLSIVQLDTTTASLIEDLKLLVADSSFYYQINGITHLMLLTIQYPSDLELGTYLTVVENIEGVTNGQYITIEPGNGILSINITHLSIICPVNNACIYSEVGLYFMNEYV